MSKVLLLNREDLHKLDVLNLQQAIETTKKSFLLHYRSDFIQPFKQVLRHKDSPTVVDRMMCLPAYLGGDVKLWGVKWLGSSSLNESRLSIPRANALIILNDSETYLPVAIIECGIISLMRTVATSCLATSYLFPEPNSIGCIGTGMLGKLHVRAFLKKFKSIKKVYLFNRNPEKAATFAECLRVESEGSVSVEQTFLAREACLSSDVLLLTSTTRNPIVFPDDIKENCLALNISLRDLSDEVFKSADRLVVDDWGQCNRQGGVINRVFQNEETQKKICCGTLGEILASNQSSKDTTGLTIVHASGMAIQDISLAARIYEKAIEQKVGEYKVWINDDSTDELHLS
jgi:ornithine cyclodeaminase/alanine dehydrogenase-like protein (mu-crystallin family)